MSRASVVCATGVSKVYVSTKGEPLLALHDVNFSVERNEFFSIVGPSGCGKTTLLNLLAGFEQPTLGELRVDDRVITAPGWERAVVFQEYALFPWYTVSQNIRYGLQRKRVPAPEQDRLCEHYIALVGLRGFEDYYPSQISGGMQKRAGLARAIALDPDVLFFDEPSAGLDPISSKLLDDLILELRNSLGATVVVVTHELASIFAIGGNSVFLDGETKTMIASGSPRDLLEHSPDPRVRRFLTRGRSDGGGSHG